MVDKHLSTQQNLLEACRVGSAHHREPTMNGFLQYVTLFWDAFAQTSDAKAQTSSNCAEHTLRKLFETASRAEVEHNFFARVGGH
jgi:hypothetical protein